MTRLAYLGPRGTYTEAAAALHDPQADLLPATTVAEAVAAVERNEADACVCALENSLEGGVRETLDQMLGEDSRNLLMFIGDDPNDLTLQNALNKLEDAETNLEKIAPKDVKRITEEVLSEVKRLLIH